jgi:hypothetical protein
MTVEDIADRVSELATRLVAPGGFPPFGMVIRVDRSLGHIASYFIDTADGDQMRGSMEQIAAKAEPGEWFAFGFDGVVDGRDAVVFFLGQRGEPGLTKHAMPYSIEGDRVRVTRPPHAIALR